MKSARVAVLSIWIGAILFFAIAVAPNVFSVLIPHEGGRALAGDIVGRALTTLHIFGFICGALFLILGLKKFRESSSWLVLAMLTLTAFSQFWITPTIHLYRNEPKLRNSIGLDFDSLPPNDPARRGFDFWHKLSTATEGAVLLLGVVALIACARRTTKD